MSGSSGTVRRRMRPADRARQLLRCAEEQFALRGFHAATMDDIAQHAGVTRTVLYQHYSSKDDLAAASLYKSRRKLHQIIGEAAGTADDPYHRLQAILRNTMAFVSDGGPLYSVLLADGALAGTGAGRQAELIRNDMESLVVDLLTEVGYGRDSAHTAMYARAIVGATERVAQALAAPPTDRAQTDAMADGVLDLVWHGLSPVPTT
ncbi:TetR/AcrR family transcriptional regulator [Mycolicibacterium fortuitum]|uniref:TetR/AcrR family transcriptional regulator n=1 Tax=Mycolicibacterium fortuitum TaxID=1766 RepID=UPI0022BA5999|nr:TetR/AcrR family transcriptional regulator [Mycolicibacterium fortuitum]WAY19746.1 TetR/AcrR family transcriptional regulator [Mycolicibacterium fortuitum]